MIPNSLRVKQKYGIDRSYAQYINNNWFHIDKDYRDLFMYYDVCGTGIDYFLQHFINGQLRTCNEQWNVIFVNTTARNIRKASRINKALDKNSKAGYYASLTLSYRTMKIEFNVAPTVLVKMNKGRL
jgi:hypothetical protein